MKIMHLLASNSLSGAEKVAIDFIKSTQMNDDDFSAFYCSPSGKINHYLMLNNIRHVPIVDFSYREIKKVIDTEKPDIIHAHDFKASVLSAIIDRAPVISHIHQNPLWMTNKYNAKSIVYRLFKHKYSKNICVSKSVEEKLINIGIQNDKVIVLPNIVSTEFTTRVVSPSIDREYDIVYVGRLSQEKRPDIFLEICKELKLNFFNLKAAIVGDGPMREQILQNIDKFNLSSNITFFGFVDNPDIVMMNSKIMSVTSDYEGFGLAAAEAQALGLPLVSTDVGGISEFSNYKSAIIEDSKYHAKSISKLLSDQNRLQEMSNESRIAIIDFLSDNNSYERIIRIYKSIIEGGSNEEDINFRIK